MAAETSWLSRIIGSAPSLLSATVQRDGRRDDTIA
jgi:hypothetical protein